MSSQLKLNTFFKNTFKDTLKVSLKVLESEA
jgi:hypothetical protein